MPLIQQFLTDVAHDSGSTGNVFSLLNQFGDGSGNGSYQVSLRRGGGLGHRYPSLPRGRAAVPVAGRSGDLRDRRPGPARDRHADRQRASGPTRPDQRLLRPAAAGRRRVHHGRQLRDVGVRRLPLGVLARQRAHDLLADPRSPDRAHSAAGIGPAGQPRGRGGYRHPCPRGGGGDHRSDRHRLDGPQRLRDRATSARTGPSRGLRWGTRATARPTTRSSTATSTSSRTSGPTPRGGCVQSSSSVGSTPALHTVNLRQFSSAISGNMGVARRVPVTVVLARTGGAVAIAEGTSRADGSWGPLTLRGRNGEPHAVGDDRDVIEILHGSGKNSPSPDLIATGDGGNPFTEAGFTGWFDLDHGYAVRSAGARSHFVIGPCGQTGVLSLRVGASLAPSPTEQCQTATDVAAITVGRVGLGTAMTMTSEDNRGGYALEPEWRAGEDDGVSRRARKRHIGQGQPARRRADGLPHVHRVPAHPDRALLGFGRAGAVSPPAPRPDARPRTRRRCRCRHRRRPSRPRRRRRDARQRRGTTADVAAHRPPARRPRRQPDAGRLGHLPGGGLLGQAGDQTTRRHLDRHGHRRHGHDLPCKREREGPVDVRHRPD